MVDCHSRACPRIWPLSSRPLLGALSHGSTGSSPRHCRHLASATIRFRLLAHDRCLPLIPATRPRESPYSSVRRSLIRPFRSANPVVPGSNRPAKPVTNAWKRPCEITQSLSQFRIAGASPTRTSCRTGSRRLQLAARQRLPQAMFLRWLFRRGQFQSYCRRSPRRLHRRLRLQRFQPIVRSHLVCTRPERCILGMSPSANQPCSLPFLSR